MMTEWHKYGKEEEEEDEEGFHKKKKKNHEKTMNKLNTNAMYTTYPFIAS